MFDSTILLLLTRFASPPSYVPPSSSSLICPPSSSPPPRSTQGPDIISTGMDLNPLIFDRAVSSALPMVPIEFFTSLFSLLSPNIVTALVSLLLRESAFSDFKCDRATSLGMNVDSLGKIFKMCGPSDSLKMKWQNEADTVNFQCESGEDDRIADFDLKLMQIESEHMEIPEQQYKVVVKMPSAEFLKVCRDLKDSGRPAIGFPEAGPPSLGKHCSGVAGSTWVSGNPVAA